MRNRRVRKIRFAVLAVYPRIPLFLGDDFLRNRLHRRVVRLGALKKILRHTPICVLVHNHIAFVVHKPRKPRCANRKALHIRGNFVGAHRACKQARRAPVLFHRFRHVDIHLVRGIRQFRVVNVFIFAARHNLHKIHAVCLSLRAIFLVPKKIGRAVHHIIKIGVLFVFLVRQPLRNRPRVLRLRHIGIAKIIQAVQIAFHLVADNRRIAIHKAIDCFGVIAARRTPHRKHHQQILHRIEQHNTHANRQNKKQHELSFFTEPFSFHTLFLRLLAERVIF